MDVASSLIVEYNLSVLDFLVDNSIDALIEAMSLHIVVRTIL